MAGHPLSSERLNVETKEFRPFNNRNHQLLSRNDHVSSDRLKSQTGGTTLAGRRVAADDSR
jgi:hypothetical protein